MDRINAYSRARVFGTDFEGLGRNSSGTLPDITVVSGLRDAHEAADYVIDGLMHNDVVKSDIHSTDTDGYSEVVFDVTQLLGFAFAPRLKNLKTKKEYGRILKSDFILRYVDIV